MKEVNVLIVVDVVGALTHDLGSNVYLIDTNKHIGSGGEGQEELLTACNDGQTLVWSVVPVNPGNDVKITGFKGEVMDKKICVPRRETSAGETVWKGRVESRGDSGKYQYSCILSFDGKQMEFDPFLQVSRG